MPATDQDIKDAQLELLKAQLDVARVQLNIALAAYATDLMNDKAGTSGRSEALLASSVKEAVTMYKAIVTETSKPDFYGTAS